MLNEVDGGQFVAEEAHARVPSRHLGPMDCPISCRWKLRLFECCLSGVSSHETQRAALWLVIG
jgi:hypothetical protein